ncbi:MAG: iron-sulfur cluster repair di-iron protein [Chitinophagales bacterium]
MKLQENNIIGDLVANDYRTATIFQAYGVDFCCNGNRSIADACKSKNIDTSKLIGDLEQIVQLKESTSIDYNSWPADLLADYIEKKHHRYVEAKIPEISAYLEKICKVHGAMHPELHEIAEQFEASAGELAMHMKKEELILFPFVRKLMKHKQSGTNPETPHFGSVENPIHMMMEEHDIEGERFRKIAALSNQYTPPADACNTYNVTFALLKEFEEDLHLHIHLENNILFPSAIAMEKELSNL